MRILRPLRGFVILGLVIAIGILGAMGASLAVLSATNQKTRTAQVYSDQAFYSAHAIFEYQMRQIMQEGQGCNSNPSPRDFMGVPLSLTRSGGKINAIVSYGTASNTFSITDPNPPTQAAAMYVDASQAHVLGNNTQLKKIYFGRLANCTQTLNIQSLTISWTPNSGERITRIEVELDDLYDDDTGLPSGSTFALSPTMTIDDNNQRKIDEIEMTNVPEATFSFGFNMSDGSTITVQATPP